MKGKWELGSQQVARSPAPDVDRAREPVPLYWLGVECLATSLLEKAGPKATWRGWEVHSPDNDQVHFCAVEF